MKDAMLSLSSEFEVELLYEHGLEGKKLAAEIGCIKEHLVGIAQDEGCTLVP